MVENPNSIPDKISNAVSNLFSSVNFDALAIFRPLSRIRLTPNSSHYRAFLR